MKLPQQLQLPQLLSLVRGTKSVHIRLALTREDDATWLARSLVVDVFPDVWVDNPASIFIDYNPPTWTYDCGRARFFAGFVPGDNVAKWFDDRIDCHLPYFDISTGRGSQVQTFQIPELYDTANGFHVTSKERDGFAVLPWPRFSYRVELMSPNANVYHQGDHDPLRVPGLRHFNNFREARAFLIHDITDSRQVYQDQDEVEIRIVDSDGWINNVKVLRTESQTKFNVTIGGLQIRPGAIIVQGDGVYEERNILGARTVTFELNSDLPPLLSFILANHDNPELDKARYASSPSALVPSSAHIIEESADAEEAKVSPSPSAEHDPATQGSSVTSASSMAENKRGEEESASHPTTVQVLRVVVVSPSDVPKERGCLRRVFEELNRGLAAEYGVRLELWQWETDTYPGFHADGPQGWVDQSMHIEKAAVVIGIFWKRFGTPVVDAQSGTEHELLRAHAAWQQSGQPHVMIYFNEQPVNLSLRELDQYRAVLDFKDRIGKNALWWSYKGPKQFEERVRQHLQQYLSERYGHR